MVKFLLKILKYPYFWTFFITPRLQMSLIQHPYQLQVSFKSVILAYVKVEFTQRYTRHNNREPKFSHPYFF